MPGALALPPMEVQERQGPQRMTEQRNDDIGAQARPGRLPVADYPLGHRGFSGTGVKLGSPEGTGQSCHCRQIRVLSASSISPMRTCAVPRARATRACLRASFFTAITGRSASAQGPTVGSRTRCRSTEPAASAGAGDFTVFLVNWIQAPSRSGPPDAAHAPPNAWAHWDQQPAVHRRHRPSCQMRGGPFAQSKVTNRD